MFFEIKYILYENLNVYLVKPVNYKHNNDTTVVDLYFSFRIQKKIFEKIHYLHRKIKAKCFFVLIAL